MPPHSYTVGHYLVDRLRELGVRHLFSVSGPHCGRWLHDCVEATPAIQRFATTNALNAGYAADGYARMNGLGAVCVPHSVGTLPLLGPVAGAFAEHVPMVVITGAPPPEASAPQAPSASRLAYEEVTCAAARVDDPTEAPSTIDRLLQRCRARQQPVYLELQSDVLAHDGRPPSSSLPPPSPSANAPPALVDALSDALSQANTAVLWGGIELQRYGLESAFDRLVRALDVPYVTSLLGKGLLPEAHPHFAGLLDETGSPAAVRSLIGEADYVLGLGVPPTCESFPASMAEGTPGALVHRHGARPLAGASPLPSPPDAAPLSLQAVLTQLCGRTGDGASPWGRPPAPARSIPPRRPRPDEAPLTYPGVFDAVAPYVTDDTIVVSGTGLHRFGSQALSVPAASGFVCQAAHGDVGHAAPAAMGVDLGSGDERVLVFVGDGGFQMTAQCLGTMAEKGLDPILFVLNNGVYGGEQRRLNADTFERDAPFSPQTILQQWHYRKLPDAMGGKGWRVETVGELTAAVEEAFKYTGGPLLIDARIQQKSLPARAEPRRDGTDEVTVPDK